MRIGIFDPYFDDLGGGEKYMMTVAECLSQKHDVSIFWDKEKDFSEFKKRFSMNLDNVTLRPNIFSPQISFWQRMIATKSYDVIIVLSDGSIPVVASKKLFLHVQQPLDHIVTRSWKDLLKLPRVNGVFYNSEFTKEFNKNTFQGVKSSVIYPPVNVQAKEVKKENIILHVGRFRVQDVLTGSKDFKKQSMMIETFKHMTDEKKVKDWKLFMSVSVKEEDEERFQKLKDSAKNYPITFFINKTNDELWELYNRAKIYWHASGFGEDLRMHPEYAEHFGMTTVEAMGAGVVPVVINSGGQKEIVINNQDGLLWSDLSQFEEQTEKLINDEILWKRLSEKAKVRAKDFSKGSFFENINRLIR